MLITPWMRSGICYDLLGYDRQKYIRNARSSNERFGARIRSFQDPIRVDSNVSMGRDRVRTAEVSKRV